MAQQAETAGPRRLHPLGEAWAGPTAGDGSVSLAVGEFRTLINLRGQADAAGFAAAVAEACGHELPTTPNRWCGTRERAALWLGPDEWLLVAPDGEAPTMETALRAARPDDPWMSIVDVSHNYISLILEGTRAPDVLARGCPLDLAPAVFGPGSCAQTLLAKTPAIIRAIRPAPAMEIWVRNSLARYTAGWLAAVIVNSVD